MLVDASDVADRLGAVSVTLVVTLADLGVGLVRVPTRTLAW